MTIVNPTRVAELGDVICATGGQWPTSRAHQAANDLGWPAQRVHIRAALKTLAGQGRIVACETKGRRYYVAAPQNPEAGR